MRTALVVVGWLGMLVQTYAGTGSAIEAASTDAQVQALVRSAGRYYSNFTVSSALQFQDKRVERKYGQAKVRAWEKADIDGNGRLDLLVTGTHHDGKSKALCLLDLGEDDLKAVEFRRGHYRSCPIASITHDGAQVLVSYADYGRPFYETDKLQGKQEFLLIYKFGGFIEYNKRPQRLAPLDSLTYQSLFAYHEVEESKLVLRADGAAEYQNCRWPVGNEESRKCEALQTRIEAQALADVLGLLHYVDVRQLRAEYSTGGNHHPLAFLSLSFGATKIKVSDDGEMGTFGLMRLYALLDQLRETQQWQTVKP